jgi:hypothetical protein
VPTFWPVAKLKWTYFGMVAGRYVLPHINILLPVLTQIYSGSSHSKLYNTEPFGTAVHSAPITCIPQMERLCMFLYSRKLEAFTAVCRSSFHFCVTSPYGDGLVLQRFREPRCLHLQDISPSGHKVRPVWPVSASPLYPSSSLTVVSGV